MSAATFTEKSQAAHSYAFNKAFNVTDPLFNSPVCEAAYCFFWSGLAEQTKKILMTTDEETWNWRKAHKHTCHYRSSPQDNERKVCEIITLIHVHFVGDLAKQQNETRNSKAAFFRSFWKDRKWTDWRVSLKKSCLSKYSPQNKSFSPCCNHIHSTLLKNDKLVELKEKKIMLNFNKKRRKIIVWNTNVQHVSSDKR